MLRLEKGQFICHSFTGGSVSVRFDGGAVRKFRCSDTSDADTSTIFLNPAGAFVTALKKSSKVTVEAEFFRGSSPIHFRYARAEMAMSS